MNWGMSITKCPYCVKRVWHSWGIRCVECDVWFHQKCFFKHHEKAGIDTEIV